MKTAHAILATLALSTALASAQEAPSSSDALRKRAEEILESGIVEARPRVGVVFEFARRLEVEGNVKEAMSVLERGLRIHSWALEEQLRYARLLKRSGDEERSRTRATLVREHAERLELVEGAAELLGEKLDLELPPLTRLKGNAPTLVLMPLADPNAALLLKAIAPPLARACGLRVVVAKIPLMLPLPSRRPLQKYLAQVRASLERSRDHPNSKAELERQGKTLEDLADDQELKEFMLNVFRRVRPSDVPALEVRFEELIAGEQWDGYALIDDIASAVHPFDRKNVCYIALTSKDIYGNETNFLFGARRWRHAVVSFHRFRAAFNQEAPNRARLLDRTLKQCITSAGHVFGVKRCSQPTCVRAYPNSLAEHDAKQVKMCAECVAGFKQALAREGGPPGPKARKATPQVPRPRARPAGPLGPEERDKLLALANQLRDRSPKARASAAQALGQLGPRAGTAAADLGAALSDSKPTVRANAAWALTRLGKAAKPALRELLVALKDRVPQVRLHAIGALGAIGPDAQRAVPNLLRFLTEPQRSVRERAAEAIARIQPQQESAIDPLIEALQDPSPKVKKFAAQALGYIGPKAKRAVRPLLEAGAKGDWMISIGTLTSAAKIDPTEPEILEAARQSILDPKENILVRCSAVRALGYLEPLARGAVPLLLEAIQSDEATLRSSACSALGQLGSKAEPILVALEAARQDENEWVRNAAVDALELLADR